MLARSILSALILLPLSVLAYRKEVLIRGTTITPNLSEREQETSGGGGGDSSGGRKSGIREA